MSDQVSWIVVEPGWDVIDAEGKRVGQVKEVLGDADKDIFSGLAVSPGLFKPTKHVPAERVGRIEEGLIRLSATRREFERFGEHDEAAAT
jgi:sporulation protein YlmC with PRC-barrel domain